MRFTVAVPVTRIAGIGVLFALLAGCVEEPYPYPPPSAPSVVYVRPARYSIPADVLFAFDSAVLRPEASAALEQTLAAIRQQVPYPAIRVDGNTDSVGAAAYNARLSLRRAQAVARWLEHHGIPAAAITEAGNGASRPVAPNTTPDGRDDPRGRALNRRVDLFARPA